MPKVLIATKLDPVAAELLAEAGLEVDIIPGLSDEALAEKIAGYEGLIVRSEKVTQKVFDAADCLKAVVRAGTGVNTIDVDYATGKNVQVMNTPGANSNSVAELALAFMLSAFRRLPYADGSVKAGRWEKGSLMGNELGEKVLGIVGLGNIGSLVAAKAKGFGMKMIGFDPVVSEGHAAEIGVDLKSLDEIFSEADVISLHIPLNDKTRGIIGADLLAKLKKGALLVNTARAETVDREALLAFLKEREDVRLATDVFYEGDKEGEKDLAEIGDRLVGTPHLGASTVEANFRAALAAGEGVRDFLVKRMVRYPVNNLEVPPDLHPRFLELTHLIGQLAYYNIGGDQPHEVRITCYGPLNRHIDVLTSYLLKGLMDIYHNEVISPRDAESTAREYGINLVKRVPDDSKGYGESMTIDILSKKQEYRETSIRGTITQEGELKINRIDTFLNVDLVPSGHMLFCYQLDRVGLINDISSALSSGGINILNIRFTTDKEGNSVAAIQTDKEVGKPIFEKIKTAVSPYKSYVMNV
jgi:D-3-phosphoglycerate dehydrogenase